MAVKQDTFVDYSSPACAAAWLNSAGKEINNTISSAGLSLDNNNQNQLKVALANYVATGTYYTDSGTANAYVLTPTTNSTGTNAAPSGYYAGMIVRFIAGNANTGASTVNVASLGLKNIKLQDGTTDPSAGDIAAGEEIICTYDGTSFLLSRALIEEATTTEPGIVTKGTKSDIENETAERYPDAASLIYSPGIAKAWIIFDGTSGTILSSHNITSLNKTATGQYTVNFSVTFSTANNVGIAGNCYTPGGNDYVLGAVTAGTTFFDVETLHSTTGLLGDAPYISISFYGDLA